MRPSESNCFILKNAPVSVVNLDVSDSNATFQLTKKPLRELKSGELLVKTLYLSNDPTQRAWIQKGIRADRMYVDPVREGDIMRSSGLAQVVELKNDKYRTGDIINTSLNWSDYLIVNDAKIFGKITNKDIPLPMYLDVLGTTGLTAYFGLLDVAKAKETDTIVISAASGATGSMCVQIAKHVIGCKKVIGISGGLEKCKFVTDLGADVCVDYKSKTFAKDILEALEGKFCDIFWDGVGGRVLDVMLSFTKPFGQVIACGAIAGYNDALKTRVLNWGQIITNRLNVKGFIVLDYMKRYEEGMNALIKWIQEGKIHYNEWTFTVVDLSRNPRDFEKIPQSWGILFSNEKGPGKLLTKVSEHKL